MDLDIKHSCDTQLIETVDDFARALNEGGQIDVIASKAFDRVLHKRLLYKLNHYGIRGSILQWIQSFLENRSQVILEGQKVLLLRLHQVSHKEPFWPHYYFYAI